MITNKPRSKRSSRPSRRTREALKWGKIQLLALYVALAGLDAGVYALAMPNIRHRVLGAILVGLIWSTACMIGIWLRHNWARYVLIFRLLVGGVFIMVVELVLTEMAVDTTRLAFLICLTLGQVIVGVVLIASPQIRTLAKPDPWEL